MIKEGNQRGETVNSSYKTLRRLLRLRKRVMRRKRATMKTFPITDMQTKTDMKVRQFRSTRKGKYTEDMPKNRTRSSFIDHQTFYLTLNPFSTI